MSAQRTKGTAPVRGWRADACGVETGGEINQNKAGFTRRSCERREGSLPPAFACGKTHLRPSRGAQNLPRFGARANFDRFAALASLFPPPAALRRRRPSEGGKVSSDFWFYHSRNVCPYRTVFGRARSPAPTAVWIYFHRSRDVCSYRAVHSRRRGLPLRVLTSAL